MFIKLHNSNTLQVVFLDIPIIVTCASLNTSTTIVYNDGNSEGSLLVIVCLEGYFNATSVCGSDGLWSPDPHTACKSEGS